MYLKKKSENFDEEGKQIVKKKKKKSFYNYNEMIRGLFWHRKGSSIPSYRSMAIRRYPVCLEEYGHIELSCIPRGVLMFEGIQYP